MRKHLILAFSLYTPLHCMEQPLITHKSDREPREWDARAYDNGCIVQTAAFLHFLTTNKINFNKELDVLDAGCGTAKITSQLAPLVRSIHAFDASKNMVDVAHEKFGHIKNLSFEHCFAEDFTSPKKYHRALMSFCFHWIKDKKLALQKISDCLENDGEFFATIVTQNNPVPIELIAADEALSSCDGIYQFVTGKKLIDLTGSSYPSNEELTTMLSDAGFSIIKQEEQTFTCPVSEEEVRLGMLPIVTNTPLMKLIPNFVFQSFFDYYINIFLSKLPKTNDGKYIETIAQTIVHARKVKNNS